MDKWMDIRDHKKVNAQDIKQNTFTHEYSKTHLWRNFFLINQSSYWI